MSSLSNRLPYSSSPADRCSFCARGRGEVYKLIEGKEATICDACVQGFQDEVRDEELDLCPVCRQRYPRSGLVTLAYLRAVCYACVLVLAQQVVVPAARPQVMEPAERGDDDRLRCSFCDEVEGETGRLFAGPRVFICAHCVAVCNAHAAQEAGEKGEAPCPVCRRATAIDALVALPGRRSLCRDCVQTIAAL